MITILMLTPSVSLKNRNSRYPYLRKTPVSHVRRPSATPFAPSVGLPHPETLTGRPSAEFKLFGADTETNKTRRRNVMTTDKRNVAAPGWLSIFFTLFGGLLWLRLTLWLAPLTCNLIGACVLGCILATGICVCLSTMWKRHCRKAGVLRRLYEVCR